jgi:hypothetical protein
MLCAEKIGYQDKDSYEKTQRCVILSISLACGIYRVKYKNLSRNEISVASFALQTKWKLQNSLEMYSSIYLISPSR